MQGQGQLLHGAAVQLCSHIIQMQAEAAAITQLKLCIQRLTASHAAVPCYRDAPASPAATQLRHHCSPTAGGGGSGPAGPGAAHPRHSAPGAGPGRSPWQGCCSSSTCCGVPAGGHQHCEGGRRREGAARWVPGACWGLLGPLAPCRSVCRCVPLQKGLVQADYVVHHLAQCTCRATSRSAPVGPAQMAHPSA